MIYHVVGRLMQQVLSSFVGSLIAEMLSFRVSLQECLSVLLTLAALLNGLVSSQLGMFLIISF